MRESPQCSAVIAVLDDGKSSAESALAIDCRASKAPDLLLMDSRMPAIDGPKTTRRLLEFQSDTVDRSSRSAWGDAG
jgi:CheY-like chemotaxis protein